MKDVGDIILIDKPAGITSFDIIRKLKPVFAKLKNRSLDEIQGATESEKGDVFADTMTYEVKEATKNIVKKRSLIKIGHAGTLDPLATGLMIIGVGIGTKKLKDYMGLDKVYIAEVLIGEKRSTGDMEGKVIEEMEVREISKKEISLTLQTMTGILRLPVSAYSAIKKGGVPMYKRARKAEKLGKEVTEVPIRDMEVFEVKLLETPTTPVNWSSGGFYISNPEKKKIVKIKFKVGSGTYIRSLAEELGKRLGYPATLYSLRRTKIGEFDIKDAKQLEEF